MDDKNVYNISNLSHEGKLAVIQTATVYSEIQLRLKDMDQIIGKTEKFPELVSELRLFKQSVNDHMAKLDNAQLEITRELKLSQGYTLEFHKKTEGLILRTYRTITEELESSEKNIVRLIGRVFQGDGYFSNRIINSATGLKDSIYNLFPSSLSIKVRDPNLLELFKGNTENIRLFNVFQKIGNFRNDLLSNQALILSIAKELTSKFNGTKHYADIYFFVFMVNHIPSLDGVENLEDKDLRTFSNVDKLYSKGITLFLSNLATCLGDTEVDVTNAFSAYKLLSNSLHGFDNAFANGLMATNYLKSQNIAVYLRNVYSNIQDLEDEELKSSMEQNFSKWMSYFLDKLDIVYLYQNEFLNTIEGNIPSKRSYLLEIDDYMLVEKLRGLKKLPKINLQQLNTNLGNIFESIRITRTRDDNIYEVDINLNTSKTQKPKDFIKKNIEEKFIRATIDMQDPRNPFVIPHLLDDQVNPIVQEILYNVFMGACEKILMDNQQLLKIPAETKPVNMQGYIAKTKKDTSTVKPRKTLSSQVQESIEANRILNSAKRDNSIIIDPGLNIGPEFLKMIAFYEKNRGLGNTEIKKIRGTKNNMWELKITDSKNRVYLELVDTDDGKRFVCLGTSRTPNEQIQFIGKYK